MRTTMYGRPGSPVAQRRSAPNAAIAGTAATVARNALVFVVLLFSPIVFPASQIPGWLWHVQQVLPFYNMAVVIRAGLTVGLVGHVATSFLILAGWTVAGITATGWVIGRRR